MRVHLSNAAWGVVDYAAYPVAMLAAAPVLLHHLGSAQYGVWIVCSAAISTGGIVASGFGDANIQHVASQRGRVDSDTIVLTVRNMMGINAALGLLVTLIALAFVPLLTRRVIGADSSLHHVTLISLSLAAILMFARAIESVCISTQRAFERYGTAVSVSVAIRVLTIAAAVALTHFALGVESIMLVTTFAMVFGVILQLGQLKRLLSAATLSPRFSRDAFRALWAFGAFSWLQAASTVLFSQADRIILAASLGAAAVTSYALCVQMAQPVYGISAAALHFLFPYLAARRSHSARRPIFLAFTLNLGYTIVATSVLLLFGTTLLRLWVGDSISLAAVPILQPIVVSFALLSLSVPAYYALLAYGRIRAVSAINIVGGLAMLLVLANATVLGLRGVAFGRILYGLIALAMYLPLLRQLPSPRSAQLLEESA
ncbi:MAG: oligosaccharide flippase family protein [Acidobacteriota bacterium]